MGRSNCTRVFVYSAVISSHRARSAELLTLLVIPGTLLLLIGFVAILLGWYGAAQTVVQQAQLSYLISGGILGLGLVITGALLLASAVWTTQLDRTERRVTDRVERITSASAQSARQLAQSAQQPAPARELQDASGGIFLNGRDVTGLPAYRRVHMGIARTFQRPELFGSLSVRDNIRVAAEMERRWSRGRLAVGSAGRRATGQESGATADEIIDVLGIGPVANQLAGGLPTGLARLVELGRALAARPLLLLLDEPSSGLDEHESLNFAQLLSEFADQGLGR